MGSCLSTSNTAQASSTTPTTAQTAYTPKPAPSKSAGAHATPALLSSSSTEFDGHDSDKALGLHNMLSLNTSTLYSGQHATFHKLGSLDVRMLSSAGYLSSRMRMSRHHSLPLPDMDTCSGDRPVEGDDDDEFDVNTDSGHQATPSLMLATMPEGADFDGAALGFIQASAPGSRKCDSAQSSPRKSGTKASSPFLTASRARNQLKVPTLRSLAHRQHIYQSRRSTASGALPSGIVIPLPGSSHQPSINSLSSPDALNSSASPPPSAIATSMTPGMVVVDMHQVMAAVCSLAGGLASLDSGQSSTRNTGQGDIHSGLTLRDLLASSVSQIQDLQYSGPCAGARGGPAAVHSHAAHPSRFASLGASRDIQQDPVMAARQSLPSPSPPGSQESLTGQGHQIGSSQLVPDLHAAAAAVEGLWARQNSGVPVWPPEEGGIKVVEPKDLCDMSSSAKASAARTSDQARHTLTFPTDLPQLHLPRLRHTSVMSLSGTSHSSSTRSAATTTSPYSFGGAGSAGAGGAAPAYSPPSPNSWGGSPTKRSWRRGGVTYITHHTAGPHSSSSSCSSVHPVSPGSGGASSHQLQSQPRLSASQGNRGRQTWDLKYVHDSEQISSITAHDSGLGSQHSRHIVPLSVQAAPIDIQLLCSIEINSEQLS